jgi:hypothetical protein
VVRSPFLSPAGPKLPKSDPKLEKTSFRILKNAGSRKLSVFLNALNTMTYNFAGPAWTSPKKMIFFLASNPESAIMEPLKLKSVCKPKTKNRKRIS